MESGFGHIMLRSPFTPYSIYLRGTIRVKGLAGPPEIMGEFLNMGVALRTPEKFANHWGMVGLDPRRRA